VDADTPVRAAYAFNVSPDRSQARIAATRSRSSGEAFAPVDFSLDPFRSILTLLQRVKEIRIASSRRTETWDR
jgi:hypothetical protein